MAKGDIKVEFLKDCEVHKKGDKHTFSRDLSNDLIRECYAKKVDEVIKEQKQTKKSK